MSTTETTLTLTKVAIKALRTADSVCFDHAAPGNGTGIRAIKRGPAPWYTDTTVNVPVKSSVFIHGDDVAPEQRHGQTARCFDMIHSARYSEEWQTVVTLLREGDEIELRWVGANDNGYLRAATVTQRSNDQGEPQAGFGERLYRDELYLHICRGGKRKYSFHVGSSICPANSARMIKP